MPTRFDYQKAAPTSPMDTMGRMTGNAAPSETPARRVGRSPNDPNRIAEQQRRKGNWRPIFGLGVTAMQQGFQKDMFGMQQAAQDARDQTHRGWQQQDAAQGRDWQQQDEEARRRWQAERDQAMRGWQTQDEEARRRWQAERDQAMRGWQQQDRMAEWVTQNGGLMVPPPLGGGGPGPFDNFGPLPAPGQLPPGVMPFGGFRADGGPVAPNQAYVVGERGPELMVPTQPGVVVPNGGGMQWEPGFNMPFGQVMPQQPLPVEVTGMPFGQARPQQPQMVTGMPFGQIQQPMPQQPPPVEVTGMPFGQPRPQQPQMVTGMPFGQTQQPMPSQVPQMVNLPGGQQALMMPRQNGLAEQSTENFTALINNGKFVGWMPKEKVKAKPAPLTNKELKMARDAGMEATGEFDAQGIPIVRPMTGKDSPWVLADVPGPEIDNPTRPGMKMPGPMIKVQVHKETGEYRPLVPEGTRKPKAGDGGAAPGGGVQQPEWMNWMQGQQPKK